MSEQKPKIIAETLEEFKLIDEKLASLPERVKSQIERAGGGIVGLECILRYNFQQEQIIYLPESTTQIKDFGDFIGIYAGDFFFRIVGDMKKNCSFNYVFID